MKRNTLITGFDFLKVTPYSMLYTDSKLESMLAYKTVFSHPNFVNECN